MQATVEVLSNLERKIIVTAPSDQVDQEVEKRLKEMLATFKLPGFRPGKVPMHLVRQRFGEAVRYEVIEKVIDKTYREALSQEKIVPAGMPQIYIAKDQVGESLEYHATLEIYPEVKLEKLDAVEIENITVDIAPKDVDEMIQKLRRQRAKWSVVDRASKKGDRVTISFEGRQNGELFEGGSAKNVPLELGSGTTIPGFEEGFTGHKAGDTPVLNLTFPADYHAAALAGKPVEFKGTLHKVEEPELPALDEDLAKQLGVKEGGIEQLRKSVHENMQREVEQKTKGHLKGQVLEKLLALHPMEIPKVMLQEELKKLQEQEQSYLQEITGKKQAMPEPRAELQDLARRRVHLGLLFNELLNQHKFTPEAERVNKIIEELTAGYENPEMIAQMYRENKNLYRQLEEKAVEDKLLDYLIAQTKQVTKNMPYSEFKGFKPIQEN